MKLFFGQMKPYEKMKLFQVIESAGMGNGVRSMIITEIYGKPVNPKTQESAENALFAGF